MRKTRARAVEDNRQTVLAAARRRFEADGFHGATLDAIADEAGFSKGVVYSQFGSKDELFLAVLEDNIRRRHEAMETRFASVGAPADLAALAVLSIGENVATVAWQAALLEFRAYAWRQPELNRRYLALHTRTIESIAGFIDAVFRGNGEVPPMPADQLASIALASSTGVLAEYMADPSIDTTVLARALGTALDPNALATSTRG